MHVFETWTETRSELFSLLTHIHIYIAKYLFSNTDDGIRIWETPLSWHANCSLPFASRVSKTRVLKLPSTSIPLGNKDQYMYTCTFKNHSDNHSLTQAIRVVTTLFNYMYMLQVILFLRLICNQTRSFCFNLHVGQLVSTYNCRSGCFNLCRSVWGRYKTQVTGHCFTNIESILNIH